MARLTREELENLKKSEGVDRIWSWSKVNCFHTSPYEYFLKYVAHVEEDRHDCIYTTTGSLCHDILERYYTDVIDYDKMIKEFTNGWIMAYDIAQLKFDRNDEKKNLKIAGKYYDNLVHFFENHEIMKYKPVIEQFVKIRVGDNVFQGYIDCAFEDADGNTHIVDFKSSSIYKGAKAENECGQLVLYALGIHQRGIPLEKIKICWNFLKYCTVQYMQKNGTIKTREVERCKMGESIGRNARMWLKDSGYTDAETDAYLMELQDTNDINALPEDVRCRYVVGDCYVYVPLTEELVNKWVETVMGYINSIKEKEERYKLLGDESCFLDDPENVKEQSYYFATLCGYSANLHKPYKKYLEGIQTPSIRRYGSKPKQKDSMSWLYDF